jgi:membrane protein
MMPDLQASRSAPSRFFGFVAAVARRFVADKCLLHASALAYATLLSLVPLLALMFSVLKGLGVQRRLEPVLLSRLALDAETTQRIIEYIDRTNVGTLGALGAVFLLLTVISVLGAVEVSFNHLWRVRAGRSYWRKVTDYLSTVLLAPILLLAAVALTSSLRERQVLEWILQTQYAGDALILLLRPLPILINAGALGLLYALMPNRRPHFGAIVAGAVVAGAVWYGVQWSYVAFQIGVARYNAIYGALAQLPLTLVWIYISWAVVLLGAEVAAVVELGPGSIRLADRAALRWPVAAHALIRAAEAFRGALAPIDRGQLARELKVDNEVVADVLERLRAAGLLAALDAGGSTYVLARDPALIDLAALEGAIDPVALPPGCDPRVEALLRRLRDERQRAQISQPLDAVVRDSPTQDVEGHAPACPQG